MIPISLALSFTAMAVMSAVALPSGPSCPQFKGADVDLLARLVHAEAGDQPLVCRVGVASVVLNRAANPSYPNTVAGVVYMPKAFRSVARGTINNRPDKLSRAAACLAVSGIDPSGGAIKFWNPGRTLVRYEWERRVVAYLGDYFFGY